MRKINIHLVNFDNFYCPEDLEMSHVETETGIRESHATKDDFI